MMQYPTPTLPIATNPIPLLPDHIIQSILSWAGVNSLKYLASGRYGSAYVGSDKILKITSDQSEAIASRVVMDNPLTDVVTFYKLAHAKIFDQFEYRSLLFPQGSNIDVLKDRNIVSPIYLILMERVKPLGTQSLLLDVALSLFQSGLSFYGKDKEFLDALDKIPSLILSYADLKDLIRRNKNLMLSQIISHIEWIIKESYNDNISELYLFLFTLCLSLRGKYAFQVKIKSMNDLVPYLSFDPQVIKFFIQYILIHDHLKSIGVFSNDLHSDNLGLDRDGNLKAFDLGLSNVRNPLSINAL